MMKCTLFLLGSCLLILAQGGGATECPSLDAAKLAKIMELVVKEDVHKELSGSSQDLWGAKPFFDKDPNTCIKHTRKFIDGTVLNQTVAAKGKWFGANEHVRQGYLVKVEKNVYLEVIPNHHNSLDIELAKIYVLYAKNGVFAYFWCMVFEPPADLKIPHLSYLSGVTVHPDQMNDPKVKASVKEAVKKIKDHKDILGEIQHLTNRAC